MPSAATRFASSADLLYYFGMLIMSRKLLRNYCLVSKYFNDMFTPILYAEVWFRQSNAQFLLEDLPILLGNPALKFTRIIDVEIPITHERGGQATRLAASLTGLFNEATQSLLEKMPNLQMFRWAGLPLYSATVLTLQAKCLNIRTLVIRYCDLVENDLGLLDGLTVASYWDFDDWDHHDAFSETRALFTTQNVPYFPNLTSLEIVGLHGNLEEARKDLVKLLLQSPRLRSLNLSICTDTIRRLQRGTAGQRKQCVEFLVYLIKDFAEAGGKPLQLKNLVLGVGVVPWKSEKSLHELVDLEYLEKVHIENNLSVFTLVKSIHTIDWEIFTPDHTPKLRAFSVFELDSVTKCIPEGLVGFTQLCSFYCSTESVNTVMKSTESLFAYLHPRPRSLTLNEIPMVEVWGNNFTQVSLYNIHALSVIYRSKLDWDSDLIRSIIAASDLRQLCLVGYQSGPEIQDDHRVGPPEVGSIHFRIAYNKYETKHLTIL
ncbi:RNI-like protein [Glarea lozoyensis ATCC 20868]|uniref:RNI-like protein n=1 Tax=Glarea lozoyensis (strain ATCC 20868 / MF5171) TaxID=1116229 RepID=S3EE41_GLAL2|nr:RNI-like protein [Glarea lozoyensis ATCC 20868]EPE36538.1 RNI-like protein [Glarea lozoyensis ATCC 20868]